MFRRLIILTVLLSVLFITSSAKERYVYKARALLVAKASTVIEAETIERDGRIFKSISAVSKAKAFGKELVNLEFKSLNDAEDFAPIKNVECYLDKKHLRDPDKKNCRSVHFLENGEFLYLRYRKISTELISLSRDMPNVEEYNIQDVHQDFDPVRDRVYDLAAIALLVRFLELGPENPYRDLFVAVNKSIVKIRVSYISNLGNNKISIKLTPLRPGPDEFEEPFPHKIIYDTNIRVVTQIHQKLPLVGNTIIKLSKKDSSF
jgi:hypothetical protein